MSPPLPVFQTNVDSPPTGHAGRVSEYSVRTYVYSGDWTKIIGKIRTSRSARNNKLRTTQDDTNQTRQTVVPRLEKELNRKIGRRDGGRTDLDTTDFMTQIYRHRHTHAHVHTHRQTRDARRERLIQVDDYRARARVARSERGSFLFYRQRPNSFLVISRNEERER